jgi:hypothetical protein
MGKMDTFLSNIFPWMGGGGQHPAPPAQAAAAAAPHMATVPASIPMDYVTTTTTTTTASVPSSPLDVSIRRKRKCRRTSTPALIHYGATMASTAAATTTTTSVALVENEEDLLQGTESERPLKMFRGETQKIGLFVSSTKSTATVTLDVCESETKSKSSPLEQLPEDLVAHALSFLGTAQDRFALQCTNKQFQRLSNDASHLAAVQVGGDEETGLHGIVLETDTPDTASAKLTPFAMAGNLEALYMYVSQAKYCLVIWL